MNVTWVFGDVWSDSLPVGMSLGIYLISLLEAEDHTSKHLILFYINMDIKLLL